MQPQPAVHPSVHPSVQPIDARLAGACLLLGVAIMLAGTATWASTGADLDLALTQGSIDEYLRRAEASSAALCVNLGLWTLGALLLCAGGVQLAGLGKARPQAAALASYAYTVGGAAAVGFFPLWMGLVIGLAPAHAAGAEVAGVAVSLGQAATIADWIGTVMILSVGSFFLARSGRDTWVPRWLLAWSWVAAAAGVLAIGGLVSGQRALGMIDLPVGLGWLIGAGITALRLRPHAGQAAAAGADPHLAG